MSRGVSVSTQMICFRPVKAVDNYLYLFIFMHVLPAFWPLWHSPCLSSPRCLVCGSRRPLRSEMAPSGGSWEEWAWRKTAGFPLLSVRKRRTSWDSQISFNNILVHNFLFPQDLYCLLFFPLVFISGTPPCHKTWTSQTLHRLRRGRLEDILHTADTTFSFYNPRCSLSQRTLQGLERSVCWVDYFVVLRGKTRLITGEKPQSEEAAASQENKSQS